MISVNLHMTNQREGERKKRLMLTSTLQSISTITKYSQISVNPRIVTQKTVFL